MRKNLIWFLLAGWLLAMGGATVATSLLPPPPNVRITTISQLNNEEQVFICPTDSNIIIANWRDFRLGYRQIGIGRSTDGGQTWVDSLIPWQMQYFGSSAWQSDPTMTVGRDGTYYMSVLDYLSAGGPNSSAIAFYRSLDKGISWEGPFVPPPPPGSAFEDKQFITVDRTGGPFDGNLYCAWARFYDGPNRIMFVRSTDGGQTFGDSVTIGPNQSSPACGSGWDAGQFAIPMVGADGTVHVFWMGASLDSGSECTAATMIKHRRSTDGGVTFGPELLVSPVSGYMSAAGAINTYSMPVGDVDISGGPYHGNLYLAFSDIGPEGGLSDIDFVRSTDGGMTWSSRIQINDDQETDLNWQFHPWMICNEDGVIACVFYDERFDPGHYLFDLSAAYSFDGGKTFTSNHRISSVSSSPDHAKLIGGNEPIYLPGGKNDPAMTMSPMAGKLGEYVGVTAYHDKLNAVWTDTRDGNQEVYTANWQLPMLEPRQLSPANGAMMKATMGGFGIIPPTLAWSTSWKENDDQYQIEYSMIAGGSGTWTTTSNSFSAWFGDPPMPTVYPEGWYLWRVRTLNAAGTDSSAWSDYWMFYLDATPPSQPSLISPAQGSITADLTPLFNWSYSLDNSAPITYTLVYSTDSTFPVGPLTVIVGGLTAPNYQVLTNLAQSTYYWKVIVTDGVGWTTNSVVGKFTTSLSCCIGTTGNVNKSASEIPDLSDLSLLIGWLMQSPRPDLPCLAEANINASITINPDLSDVSLLIAYLTQTPKPTLPNCP
jgi:hypothetical protein